MITASVEQNEWKARLSSIASAEKKAFSSSLCDRHPGIFDKTICSDTIFESVENIINGSSFIAYQYQGRLASLSDSSSLRSTSEYGLVRSSGDVVALSVFVSVLAPLLFEL